MTLDANLILRVKKSESKIQYGQNIFTLTYKDQKYLFGKTTQYVVETENNISIFNKKTL